MGNYHKNLVQHFFNMRVPNIRSLVPVYCLAKAYTVHSDDLIHLHFDLTREKMAEAVTFALTQVPGQFWQNTHTCVKNHKASVLNRQNGWYILVETY